MEPCATIYLKAFLVHFRVLLPISLSYNSASTSIQLPFEIVGIKRTLMPIRSRPGLKQYWRMKGKKEAVWAENLSVGHS